jgi:hypothetical protein
MAKTDELTSIIEQLVSVAKNRKLTSAKPWDRGWSDSSYRRSPTAAISHDQNRSVRLTEKGVDQFEKACGALLRLQPVRERYDIDEFWGLIASLVGTLPLDATPMALAVVIKQRLTRVLNPPASIVLLPLANVAPPQKLIDVGSLVIGLFDEHFKNRVHEKIQREIFSHVLEDVWWAMPPRTSDSARPVVLACIGQGQLDRAIDAAEQLFEDLISIALMMEPDLDALSLYSLRGAACRPGVRGLSI